MKLLLGGSPCTHWSIAQTKNRETEPSGVGWELFENYLIAREKFKPDFFLYENNKSMSKAIREEITRRLGVEPICINSALVSAQNRQRLYWTNIPGVQQPEDRGILLRDILETGIAWREKAYTLKANYYKTSATNAMDGGHFPAPMVAEPLKILSEEYYSGGFDGNLIGMIENPSVYRNGKQPSQQYRVYTCDGKSVCVDQDQRKHYIVPWNVHEATKQGYATIFPGEYVGLAQPNSKTRRGHRMAEKSNCLTTSCAFYEYCGTADRPIYRVDDGYITINGKKYPIKLEDGCYIIRKLTVTELQRLQTVPDSYVFPVSDTQAYKMLGNGWTVDVIAHILFFCPGITAEPLDVLSMYDGMACGHIALDKLGAHIQRYRATEIDKYAIKTACHNFPDIEQLGDAYQVRDWKKEHNNAP